MSTSTLFSCPDAFYREFERKSGQPWTTHYCPGCGHGLVHKYVAEAIDQLGIQDRTIFVSPVGCAVFGYYYFDVGNVQVAHGRCPAAATALKRAHPDSIVLGYQGDGDLAAIGGNEIVHAANRGENISIFFVNNAIYGMTGGQLAPTSPLGMKTTTTPLGRRAESEGFPIRVCELLSALDAPYYLERVAVGDPRHNARARRAIQKAIRNQIDNRGFSLVEILAPCPTGWKSDPVDAARHATEELTRVFPLGVFRDGHDLELGHPRRRSRPEPDEIPGLLGLPAASEGRDLAAPPARGGQTALKISGFGGQGVLLLGTLLAHAGMLAGRRVCWMPSYGPEMRGGTAHCNVTVSEEEIGSPVVHRPDVLIAMNGPSVDRFAGDVVPGGLIVINGSMVDTPPDRDDVTIVSVPVGEIAERLGNPQVGNLVALGALLGKIDVVSRESVLAALPAVVKGDEDLIALNRRALQAGMEHVS